MPRYEYFCPANERHVEVSHSITLTLATWGEVCEAAGLPADDSAAPDAPVQRVLHGGMLLVDKPRSTGGHCCGDSGCGGGH